MYTAQNIYDLAIDLIDERLASGAINATNTTIYKARTLGLLTSWQNEIATCLNITIPDPITDLTQVIIVGDRISGQYYLASQLLLVEDSDRASFFNDKFMENKRLYLSRLPVKIMPLTDVYEVDDGTN